MAFAMPSAADEDNGRDLFWLVLDLDLTFREKETLIPHSPLSALPEYTSLPFSPVSTFASPRSRQ